MKYCLTQWISGYFIKALFGLHCFSLINIQSWELFPPISERTFRFVSMTAIILHILRFPVTILMNVLVIMAVIKDKTQTAKQIQHFAGPLVEAVSQPTFIGGQIYVIKGLSLTVHYRFLMETTECFKCISLSFDSYAALRYRFCCMTIAMGLRLLKMKCTNLNEQWDFLKNHCDIDNPEVSDATKLGT